MASTGVGAWVALASLIGCGVLSKNVAAQDAPLPDDGNVVVTGSRLPGTATGLAQNVTVIDHEEIAASAPARIEDLLGRVTGAYVDQPGRAGGFSSLYLRGAENSHLLIMLDGVKLNDPTTTRGSAYDLSSLDTEQIERLEVLRGPASAVYGGEALAGVLNVITRRPGEGLTGSGHVALGTNGYGKLGADVAFGRAALRGDAGVARTEDGESGSDSFLRSTTAHGALRFALGSRFSGELFTRRIERQGEAFADDSGGPRLAENRSTTHRDSEDLVYGLTFAATDLNDFRLGASVSWFERSERSENAAVTAGLRQPIPAFTSDTSFRRSVTTLTVARDFGSAASVIAGFEYQQEVGGVASLGDFFGLGFAQALQFDLRRKTDAAFVEGHVRLMRGVTAQVGLRRDSVEGVDARTTPNFGIVWELPDGDTVLKANIAEGFKAPSFFALGFPIGANPDLGPERSRSRELTVSHRLDEAASTAEVSVFRTHYQGLVDFDGTRFLNVNRGAIVISGIEAGLTLDRGRDCRTRVGASLLDIDVRDGMQVLRNRPEQTASASLMCDVGRNVTLFASARYVGSFLDRSNPTGDIRMPTFSTFDLGGAFKLGAMQLNVSADNIFNHYYEQFVGFPGQDRRLRIMLRRKF